MKTTAPASAPPAFPWSVSTAGPSWHTPHIKQEPCDGEAVGHIPPGRGPRATQPPQSISYLGQLDTTQRGACSNHQQIAQGASLPQMAYHHQQQLGSAAALCCEPLQIKQEVSSPPESTAQTPTTVSHYDHSSTEGEGGLQRFLSMAMPNRGTIYKCPLCTVHTRDKKEFRDHLGSHSVPRCPSCYHVANTAEQLHAHMWVAHALSPPQDDPKINSRGRVKTYLCKHCGYVAVTKLDFWTHSRCHIKKEKLLTCNRCPFVTAYKHHLEYHLRNHKGWKPFHCDQCDYSCVNKSMLNTHLKSHSNIYQYRCADCGYATKYSYSMKMHLRKFHHPLELTKPEPSSLALVRSPSPMLSTSAFAPQPSTSAFVLPSEDAPAPAPAVVIGPSATKHCHKGKDYKLECIQYQANDESADQEPERKHCKAERPADPEVEPQPSSERPDSSEAEDGEDSSEFVCL